MEKQLFKKLLNREFFLRNKDRVRREYFADDLKRLYDTLSEAHTKYETDLTVEWLKTLHHEYNPVITRAQSSLIAILLDDIEHEDCPPDDMADDLIISLHKNETARKIANAALDVINGTTNTFGEVRRILEDVTDDGLSPSICEEVPFDLDRFLEQTSPAGLFKFRLPTLSAEIYGAGRGNFIIVFARPEVGKTSYMCYETAGFLKQGLRVAYFANEEPAFRVYLRLLCSYLEEGVPYIEANKRAAIEKFNTVRENLWMNDCVGMSITDVDAWVGSHRPDVVILDQLDKFNISGNFTRGDERLGELYTYAREIAKRNDCLVYGVSQCSADGEGLQKIDYSMLAGSKTAKAGEADIILGIGRNPQLHGENDHRMFNISKNKINGWHGEVGAVLNRLTATYEV
jgi:hypothetical protein